ncbi:MAG: hypothetical protein FWD86_01990 [Firmicutes bacterium]|nr:hypothetical protein [Bacillota bacterium]
MNNSLKTIDDLKKNTKLSPIMQQYLDLKKEALDAFLFFRIGDFYELFFDDAVQASRLLDLALTARDCGGGEKAPMCGIPHHVLDDYVAKLIKLGKKAAICEQEKQPQEQSTKDIQPSEQLTEEQKKDLLEKEEIYQKLKNGQLSKDQKQKYGTIQLKLKEGKNLLSRSIVKIVTPGTAIDEEVLQKDKSNYLCSVFCDDTDGSQIYLAWIDVSNSEIFYQSFNSTKKFVAHIIHLAPAEVIATQKMFDLLADQFLKNPNRSCPLSLVSDNLFDLDKSIQVIMQSSSKNNTTKEGIFESFNKNISMIKVAGSLLLYILSNNKSHPIALSVSIDKKDYLQIDFATASTLELFKNATDNTKNGSLLDTIDMTSTDMGARLLYKWVARPLVDRQKIINRLDAVESLKASKDLDQIIKILSEVGDIERIFTRLSQSGAAPKNCYIFGQSLKNLAKIKQIIDQNFSSQPLKSIAKKIHDLSGLYQKIIDFVSPSAQKRDKSIINFGANPQLDKCKKTIASSEKLVLQLEEKEREATKIKGLKIGYNKICGYFIEIQKSASHSIPYRYKKTQSLQNADRFVTVELRELQEEIFSAEEQAAILESEIYEEIINSIKQKSCEVADICNATAVLDCLCSLASIAKANNYSRPQIGFSPAESKKDGLTDGIDRQDADKNIDLNSKKAVDCNISKCGVGKDKHSLLQITNGRHPSLEHIYGAKNFVPNNTFLDGNKNRIMLITGPNMSGKSVYLRQVALIAIMAHIGSFVPADYAFIPIVDKIFTRIGAHDDSLAGRSTFMVEMSELSDILDNCTADSLVFLDEIGRGTSMQAGLSIAQATIEFFIKHTKSKVLFSTHFHQLTELEREFDSINNYKMEIKEDEGKIVFLNKLTKGVSDKSFGIEVAAMTGIDKRIIDRAKEIFNSLDSDAVAN